MTRNRVALTDWTTVNMPQGMLISEITGVIQAGGRSTRMGGEPKALLELGGRRIIERVRRRPASRSPTNVLIVTNTPELYA